MLLSKFSVHRCLELITFCKEDVPRLCGMANEHARISEGSVVAIRIYKNQDCWRNFHSWYLRRIFILGICGESTLFTGHGEHKRTQKNETFIFLELWRTNNHHKRKGDKKTVIHTLYLFHTIIIIPALSRKFLVALGMTNQKSRKFHFLVSYGACDVYWVYYIFS